MRKVLTALLWCNLLAGHASAQMDYSSLATLRPGKTGTENALWVETPPNRRFDHTTTVICADLRGPAEITMIHFAYPQRDIATTRSLGRELLLRIYWDGEAEPSVDCPMVDFFCDPAGKRKIVHNALVNKNRGFNAYFPMPFKKSARIELVYDGHTTPSQELWALMPCYSYVMYRMRDDLPAESAYFHAHWRHELIKLGERHYMAMETSGRGKFVGWNVTIRRPGRPDYPVDMNENFYVDGESSPSISFQGIEDSFGYSWGFPAEESQFALTGWFPFLEGAAAYRLFINDAISFEKSLKVTIGFGDDEHGFNSQFSGHGTALEMGSTCYWYQVEPHTKLPVMPGPSARQPCPSIAFWPDKDPTPTVEEIKARGVKLLMQCGHPSKEIAYAAEGFSAAVTDGFSFAGFPGVIHYCRAKETEFSINVKTPPWNPGKLRIYIQDPDRFGGGRHQRIFVNDRETGEYRNFEKGQWIEVPFTKEENASGNLTIRTVNLNPKSNAVISQVEWVEN